MKRRIKFRCYDEATKSFFYSDELDWGDDLTKLWHFFGAASKFHAKKVDQFTGLVDSEGKDIYEGDIITEKDTRYNEISYEIKYCRGSFSGILAFHPIDKDGSHLNYYYGDWTGGYVKIIGNIHQNPELLQ